MPFREIIKKMLQDFPKITAGVLAGQSLFCTVFMPQASFDIQDLWNILIGGVVFVLPHLVFVSAVELSKERWRRRLIFHLLLVEATVITCAHYPFGWLDDWEPRQHVMMALLVFGVYLLTAMTDWKITQTSADRMNLKLWELKREDSVDPADTAGSGVTEEIRVSRKKDQR